MPVYGGPNTAKGLSQFVTAPYGWDAGYKEGQAAVAVGGTMRVCLLGHSIMSGVGTTTQSTDGLHWLLRNALVAKYSQSADYFPVTQSQDAHNFGSGYTWPNSAGAPPPWVMNVQPYGYDIGTPRLGPFGVASLSYGGMGGDATWINPGDGTDIATFTTQSWLGNCQAFDIVYPNITAGTSMRWSVDGGATTNITIGSTGRIEVLQPAGLSGLSNAQHTILIEGVGASGQPWLSGIVAHKTTRGAAGVQIAHIAASSSTFYNFDANYLDKTLLARDSSTGTVGNGIFPMGPDLVITDYFGISSSADISPQRNLQRMGAFIECLRRANPNCSIIFIADHTPNPVTTDGTFPPDIYTFDAPLFIQAAQALASSYGCPSVNVHGAWQGRAVANGYTQSTDIHPTTLGAANIASMITPLL